MEAAAPVPLFPVVPDLAATSTSALAARSVPVLLPSLPLVAPAVPPTVPEAEPDVPPDKVPDRVPLPLFGESANVPFPEEVPDVSVGGSTLIWVRAAEPPVPTTVPPTLLVPVCPFRCVYHCSLHYPYGLTSDLLYLYCSKYLYNRYNRQSYKYRLAC